MYWAREDDLDRGQPCKKSGCLSICHSVLEHKSRKSRELLRRFSQNLVIYIFRARKDDLDSLNLIKI